MYPDMLLLLPRGYRVKGGYRGYMPLLPAGGEGGGTEQRGYVLLLSAGGYRARGYLLLLPEGGYGTGYIKSCQSGTGISITSFSDLVFCC